MQVLRKEIGGKRVYRGRRLITRLSDTPHESVINFHSKKNIGYYCFSHKSLS